MKEPVVSIVIATFNRRDELEETLKNIELQAYRDIEVIVVDNHSDDGTPEMIRQKFPWVNLIELQSNVGPVIGRNIGFRRARGRYIVSLDSDSFPERHSLERMTRHFEKWSDIGCIAFDIRNYERFYSRDKEIGWIPPEDDQGIENHSFSACGVGMRADLLREFGYWEEWFTGPFELAYSLRVWNGGYRIVKFTDTIVYHKRSDISRNLNLRVLRAVENLYLFFWKYFPLRMACLWIIKQLFHSLSSGMGTLLSLRCLFLSLSKLIGTARFRIKKDALRRIRVFTRPFRDVDDVRVRGSTIIECPTEMLNGVKKVLLIRSVAQELIPRIREKIKQVLPGCEIHLLTHRSVTSSLYEQGSFVKIFYYDTMRDFTVLRIGFRLLSKLRKERYDLVVFPHYGNHINGYYNVVILQFAISAGMRASMDLNGSMSLIDKRILLSILWNYIHAFAITATISPAILLYLLNASMVSWVGKRINRQDAPQG